MDLLLLRSLATLISGQQHARLHHFQNTKKVRPPDLSKNYLNSANQVDKSSDVIEQSDVTASMRFHTFVVYEFMLCSAVSIVLVSLYILGMYYMYVHVAY